MENDFRPFSEAETQLLKKSGPCRDAKIHRCAYSTGWNRVNNYTVLGCRFATGTRLCQNPQESRHTDQQWIPLALCFVAPYTMSIHVTRSQKLPCFRLVSSYEPTFLAQRLRGSGFWRSSETSEIMGIIWHGLRTFLTIHSGTLGMPELNVCETLRNRCDLDSLSDFMILLWFHMLKRCNEKDLDSPAQACTCPGHLTCSIWLIAIKNRWCSGGLTWPFGRCGENWYCWPQSAEFYPSSIIPCECVAESLR